ncbi:MAG TPA: cytochrome c [Rhodanobacter sp.]|jgi:mono/diheme cytochrome c family protein|nr:cytochrome c [Rhodanobacter sp.]
MKSIIGCLFGLIFLAAGLGAPARAAELAIDLGHGVVHWSTAALLARSDVQSISVPFDVAFRHSMHYQAIPLADLLDGITSADHLQFVGADGFAVEFPAALILNRRGSTAWLAIEDPTRPWPELPGQHGAAGPFYVVWTKPKADQIGPEQWPYQLVAIRKLDGVAARFPALLPDPALPAGSPVRRGLTVFQQTCFACHTLNGAGDAKLGPDLNIPYSPVEYLDARLLRAYIRNPQSLRRWPQARMPGFSTQALSDADLDALLAYLGYMAGHKIQPAAPH